MTVSSKAANLAGFLEQLNRFFGDLCKDERYIRPTLMEVPVRLQHRSYRHFRSLMLYPKSERPPLDPMKYLFGCGKSMLIF